MNVIIMKHTKSIDKIVIVLERAIPWNKRYCFKNRLPEIPDHKNFPSSLFKISNSVSNWVQAIVLTFEKEKVTIKSQEKYYELYIKF